MEHAAYFSHHAHPSEGKLSLVFFCSRHAVPLESCVGYEYVVAVGTREATIQNLSFLDFLENIYYCM